MKLPSYLLEFGRLLVPRSLRHLINKAIIISKVSIFKSHYKKKVESLKHKEKVTVAFFLIHSSVWKLDTLYHLLQSDDKFKPIVVICPYMGYDEKRMLDDFGRCESFCKERGYDYLLTYNYENSTWKDIRKEISPDIIFFTNPYKGITKDEYYITNFPNSLNCYVTYSSVVFGNLNWELNQELHNYVWRYFIENEIIQEMSVKTSFVKGDNTLVTGFPGFDMYLNPLYKPKSVWKHKQQIKIIWAPHHTIEDNPLLQFSSFLKYFNFFLEIAKSNVDKIQIAFKPHPILKSKLYNVWGIEKTDSYYDLWDTMPNTQLEESLYEDLFATSDAMIFDSVSFINEYLYTKKPSLFLYTETVEGQLNDFGLKALHCHKIGLNELDIKLFVISLIKGEKDSQEEEKEFFYNTYLLAPNHKSASTNIYEEIRKIIS